MNSICQALNKSIIKISIILGELHLLSTWYEQMQKSPYIDKFKHLRIVVVTLSQESIDRKIQELKSEETDLIDRLDQIDMELQ